MLPPLTDQTRRISSLDFLRGIALLGILLVNIQSFALPQDARQNPLLFGNFEGFNYFAYLFTYLVADQKFITIFSILFGAGILLQSQSAENKNLSPAKIHYKRMLILLAIGLGHAYLLWYGDILVPYALCGMLVFPLRALSARSLFALAVVFMGITTLLALPQLRDAPPTQGLYSLYFHQIAGLDMPTEIADYHGSYLTQMHHRVPTAFAAETSLMLMWTLWRCSGCMLLGMALQKCHLFSPPTKKIPRYFLAAILLIASGTALTVYSLHLNLQNNFSPDIQIFASSQPHYYGSILTALGYIALLIPLTKFAPSALLAIGRTALSNYLLQTLLCTTLFYGHGCNHFAEFSRIQLLLVTLIVWTIQIILTTLYLRRFTRGPLEALWHRMVYAA